MDQRLALDAEAELERKAMAEKLPVSMRNDEITGNDFDTLLSMPRFSRDCKRVPIKPIINRDPDDEDDGDDWDD